MPTPRWSLAALFWVVLFAALAAGIYRTYYSGQHPNALLWLSIFLVTLSSATLGAWRGHAPIRRPCAGYAVFGWTYVVFVLIVLGWPLATIYDAERMATNSRMGMLLGCLAAIAAIWVLPSGRHDNLYRPVGRNDGDS